MIFSDKLENIIRQSRIIVKPAEIFIHSEN